MNKIRIFKDKIFERSISVMTILSWTLLFGIIIGLIIQSYDILSTISLGKLLFSTSWNPSNGEFGFLPFILGTLWVTLLALIISVPICVLTGIFLSEYTHTRFQNIFRPIIDLLAGIPSVVYGLWGVLTIVPLIKKYIAPIFGITSSGYTILAGGIVLAVMIAPIIINITFETLKIIPRELREASLALGATKWQSVKTIAFKKGLTGILAGIVLAFSRAFGETMAVLMVVGNVDIIPNSIFDPAYTLPALIANGYGELMSIPLYKSALLFASLILMCVVILFNTISRLILNKIEESTR